MNGGWEEPKATAVRMAGEVEAARVRSRQLLERSGRVRRETEETRSRAAERRVESNNRRLARRIPLPGRTLAGAGRDRCERAIEPGPILRRAAPSQRPRPEDIIALHELHAEHERSHGREGRAEEAERRADRIRHLAGLTTDDAPGPGGESP